MSLRIAVIGDHQLPYHDARAIRVAREIMRDFKPHRIINVGDYYDLPDLSTKFTRTPEFRNQLGMVRKIGLEIIEKDLAATGLSPEAYTLIEGNHEKRLRDYVTTKADALYELTAEGGALTLPVFMQLPPGLTYVKPYPQTLEINFGGGGSFLARHGTAVGKYPAAAEIAKFHESGVSGHTHRIGNSFEPGWKTHHGWWSNGALCNVEGPNVPPDFAGASTDRRGWQQGITLLDFSSTRKLFDAHTVVIDHGRARWRGKDYIDRGGK